MTLREGPGHMPVGKNRDDSFWVPFSLDNMYLKRRWPKEKKYVLVRCKPESESHSPLVAVGYLKYAAGDKSCPYFVIPGGHANFIVDCFNDCLPEGISNPWATMSDLQEGHAND